MQIGHNKNTNKKTTEKRREGKYHGTDLGVITGYSASVFVLLTQCVLRNKVSKVRMGIHQLLFVPLSKHRVQHVTQGHLSSSGDYLNGQENSGTLTPLAALPLHYLPIQVALLLSGCRRIHPAVFCPSQGRCSWLHRWIRAFVFHSLALS